VCVGSAFFKVVVVPISISINVGHRSRATGARKVRITMAVTEEHRTRSRQHQASTAVTSGPAPLLRAASCCNGHHNPIRHCAPQPNKATTRGPCTGESHCDANYSQPAFTRRLPGPGGISSARQEQHSLGFYFTCVSIGSIRNGTIRIYLRTVLLVINAGALVALCQRICLVLLLCFPPSK
jgi:hypothetical protein